LSLASQTPINPLFIIRTGYRKHKIVVREPIACFRGNEARGEVIADAMGTRQSWRKLYRLLAAVVRACAVVLIFRSLSVSIFFVQLRRK
jgi:hypothetical protein